MHQQFSTFVHELFNLLYTCDLTDYGSAAMVYWSRWADRWAANRKGTMVTSMTATSTTKPHETKRLGLQESDYIRTSLKQPLTAAVPPDTEARLRCDSGLDD